MRQQTIKHSIHVEGIGLHSGKNVCMTLQPAPANTGVVFRRLDLKPVVELPVQVDHIIEAPLCTLLVQGEHQVATIEHLMAALCALGVDNVYIDLDADEVPVMDGSSASFVFLLQSTGVREQDAVRRYLKIKAPVRVEEDDRFVELAPLDEGCLFDVSIDDHGSPDVIGKTELSVKFSLSQNGFIKEVSRARTFGFAHQLEQLHQMDRALGASLDNAVGIDPVRVLNPEGLRYPDEFVRHKLLDCIGDLYVVGHIQGHFRGHKTSHALNNRLLKTVLAQQDAWEWVE